MLGSFFQTLVPGDIVHVPEDMEYRFVIGVVKRSRNVVITWYTITSIRPLQQRCKFWSYEYIPHDDSFIQMVISFAAERSSDE